MTTTLALKVGQFYSYNPMHNDGTRNDWCREGEAIVSEWRGELTLVDTYWHWGEGSDDHRLTEAEMATAELLFDADDFDELDRYKHGTPDLWLSYAPADRESSSAQHNLSRRYFVRKGSKPDLETKVLNAEGKVHEAESNLASAESRLKWARHDLAELVAERTDSEPR